MSPAAKQFVEGIGLPAGHHLSEEQEQMIGAAFDRWCRENIAQNAAVIGLIGDFPGVTPE